MATAYATPTPTDPNDRAMMRLRAQNAAYALHSRYTVEDLATRQQAGRERRWLRLAQESANAAGEVLNDKQLADRARAMERQHLIKARMAGIEKQRQRKQATQGATTKTQTTKPATLHDLTKPRAMCPACWREQHPRKAWPANYSTALCERHSAATKAAHTPQLPQTPRANH